MKHAADIGAFAFGCIVVAAIYALAMERPIDHDEHQFVASSALLAQNGLVPHLDFPYFHVPYLSALYATVFLATDHLLASARAVSATAAIGLALIVWIQATALLSSWRRPARRVGAALFVLAFVVDPLFFYTGGRAWNHDVALLAALLAALAVAAIPASRRPGRTAIVAGLLAALAAGTRLTLALVIPALVVAAAVVARSLDAAARRRAGWGFAGGLALGLSPLAMLAAAAPAEFVWGALTYHVSLNPLYRELAGQEPTVNLSSRLLYVADTLTAPRTAALIGAYAISGFGLIAERRATPAAVAIAACIPLLVLSPLSSTPIFYQYFYAPIPFLFVGTIVNLAALQDRRWRTLGAIALVPLFAAAVLASRHYVAVLLSNPDQWGIVMAKKAGEQIAASTSPGRILTLGPIYALEGGRSVYPAFATGPFVWRIAPLVDTSTRSALGLLGPDELDRIEADRLLRGVLTGSEVGPEGQALEAPLINLAKQRGWAPHRIDARLTLWAPTP